MISALMLIEFKKYIQSDVTDTTHDNELSSLLERAQLKTIHKLGYSWIKTAVTAELHDPKVYIYPSYLPILASPAPVITLNSTALVSLQDYWRYEQCFYIPYLRGNSELPLTLSIAYTGGYPETDLGILPYWQLVFSMACHWQKTMQELNPQTFVDTRLPDDIESMFKELGVTIF